MSNHKDVVGSAEVSLSVCWLVHDVFGHGWSMTMTAHANVTLQ
jgi:hypothetical protein